MVDTPNRTSSPTNWVAIFFAAVAGALASYLVIKHSLPDPGSANPAPAEAVTVVVPRAEPKHEGTWFSKDIRRIPGSILNIEGKNELEEGELVLDANGSFTLTYTVERRKLQPTKGAWSIHAGYLVLTEDKETQPFGAFKILRLTPDVMTLRGSDGKIIKYDRMK